MKAQDIIDQELLTYQQSRLLELVDGAGREQREYLLAPLEAEDAGACVGVGLLTVSDDSVARLTEDGHSYIIYLNSNH